jgi:hypothetical protein
MVVPMPSHCGWHLGGLVYDLVGPHAIGIAQDDRLGRIRPAFLVESAPSVLALAGFAYEAQVPSVTAMPLATSPAL